LGDFLQTRLVTLPPCCPFILFLLHYSERWFWLLGEKIRGVFFLWIKKSFFFMYKSFGIFLAFLEGNLIGKIAFLFRLGFFLSGAGY
jgi:hypothetical protein